MVIKAKMENDNQEGFQNYVQEFFKDITNDEEFDKRMNELENIHTPKREILQDCKEVFYSVLDAFIQDTLTKEKALLLLQSKYHQLQEGIKDMAAEGTFIQIDYEDGHGYIPEEFMKIADEVNYYYNITKNNIGNAGIELETFSSPAVKRVVESVSASFGKYFGKTDKKESQPKKETVPPPQNTETQAPKLNAISKITPDNTLQIENNSPEKVEYEINKTIAMLMEKGHIKKQNSEYIMTKTATFPKIIAELKVQKNLGNINIPATDGIVNFIVAYIKNKDRTELVKDNVEKALKRL